MIAILGGLGAALAWTVATLCSSRASRLVGPPSTLSVVMLTGLVLTLPIVAFEGVPTGLDAGVGGWLVLVGAGNVVGLVFLYAGLRIGKVGVVAPIASTEGAVTAVIAVAAGEHIGTAAGVALIVIVIGVAFAATTRGGPRVDFARSRRAVLFAIGAALWFGAGLYAAGRVSTEVPVGWILLPTRAMGVLFVALPLVMRSRLHVNRSALPFLVVAGIAEVVGVASYAIGARHGIAIAVVMASQYAAIATIAAYVLFRERLTPIQIGGVTAIAAGVAAISALTV